MSQDKTSDPEQEHIEKLESLAARISALAKPSERTTEAEIQAWKDGFVAGIKDANPWKNRAEKALAILERISALIKDPFDMDVAEIMEPPWQVPCVLLSDLKKALGDDPL